MEGALIIKSEVERGLIIDSQHRLFLFSVQILDFKLQFVQWVCISLESNSLLYQGTFFRPSSIIKDSCTCIIGIYWFGLLKTFYAHYHF